MLRKQLKKIYRFLTFKDSSRYWENRYSKGGNSGAGSYGELAEYKANFINQFIENKKIQSITDFGCGDGNNLSLLRETKYFGLDVANSAIKICKEKFSHDRSKSFHHYNKAYKELNLPLTDLAMSLDVIFHLVEDEIFTKYMQDLFSASNKYVIIYSSNISERPSAHVRHRVFTKFIEENISDWQLVNKEPNPYQSRSKENQKDFRILANFYTYKKN